jgi:hypothetical protein
MREKGKPTQVLYRPRSGLPHRTLGPALSDHVKSATTTTKKVTCFRLALESPAVSNLFEDERCRKILLVADVDGSHIEQDCTLAHGCLLPQMERILESLSPRLSGALDADGTLAPGPQLKARMASLPTDPSPIVSMNGDCMSGALDADGTLAPGPQLKVRMASLPTDPSPIVSMNGDCMSGALDADGTLTPGPQLKARMASLPTDPSPIVSMNGDCTAQVLPSQMEANAFSPQQMERVEASTLPGLSPIISTRLDITALLSPPLSEAGASNWMADPSRAVPAIAVLGPDRENSALMRWNSIEPVVDLQLPLCALALSCPNLVSRGLFDQPLQALLSPPLFHMDW